MDLSLSARRKCDSMNQEELIKWIKAVQPFSPLRIHLSNGESFDLHHPDAILVGRNTSAILVNGDIHPISNVHINHIEPLVTAQ